MLGSGTLEERIRSANWILEHPELQDNTNHAQEYIHYARSNGYDDILAMLTAAGIEQTAQLADNDPRRTYMNNTYFRGAILAQDIDTVIRGIASGISINQADIDGDTLLMFALANGAFDIAGILVAVGAEVNKVNRRGESAMSMAANIKKQFENDNDPEIIETIAIMIDLLRDGNQTVSE